MICANDMADKISAQRFLLAHTYRALVAATLLVCRAGVFTLCGFSFAYVTTARDADDYTPIRFLEVVLVFQLIWSATRLVYDAAVTLFHAPLRGRGASVAIVIGEFVLSCLTYAAGMCTLGVQVYMERDVRACDFLPPGDCSRYRASVLLALSATVLAFTNAVLLFCLWAPHDHAQG